MSESLSYSKATQSKIKAIIGKSDFKSVLVTSKIGQEESLARLIAEEYLKSRGMTYSKETVLEVNCSMLTSSTSLDDALSSSGEVVFILSECEVLSNSGKNKLMFWMENNTTGLLFIGCFRNTESLSTSPLLSRFKYVISEV